MPELRQTALQRVDFRLAFVAWLFLLVVPCFFVGVSFEKFFQYSYQQKAEMIKPQLHNEMNQFVEELQPEFWLKNKLDQFNQKFGFIEQEIGEIASFTAKFSSYDSAFVRKQLEKHLRVRVSCLFYYGPDCARADYDISDKQNFNISPFPNVLLKRMFGFLAGQHNTSPIFNDSSGNSIKKMLENEGEKRIQRSMEFLLQTFSGNITPLTINSYEVYRTIAAKLGDTQAIFFHFAPARLKKDGKTYNAGGYLAIIRSTDIAPRLIVDAALEREKESLFRRGLTCMPQSVKFPEHYLDGEWGHYQFSEGRLFYRAFAPESFLHFLTTRGSIETKNLSTVRKNRLMLEVSADKSLLGHRLEPWLKHIRFILAMVFLAGSAVFVRLALFGFNLRLSVAVKILLAVMLAAILPLTMTFLAYLTNSDFEERNQSRTVKQYLELRQSMLQKQINSRLSEYQRKNLELASQLEEVDSVQSRKDLINRWLKHSNATSAYLERRGEKEVLLENGEKFRKLAAAERELLMTMTQSYMQFLYQSEYMGQQISNLAMVISQNMNNTSTFHDFLRLCGTFIDIPRISQEFKFSTLPIFEKQGNGFSVPTNTLILCFPQNLLLESVFADLHDSIELSEKWGDYQIDMAICWRKGDKLVFMPEYLSKNLMVEKIQPIVSLAGRLRRQIVWENEDRGRSEILIARFEQSLPYIALFRASKTKNAGFAIAGGEFTMAYLLALFASILVISKILFIDPVEKIANGLEQVAAGSLEYRFSLDTGDEFSDLATQFNRMTSGLIERETLAGYVSEDVLRAVSQENELVLKPGGELIEASILFCEPVDFEKIAGNFKPFEVLEMLNRFLAGAARVTSRYGGSIDKLIDKTLMIVFRNDSENPGYHALQACRTACELRRFFAGSNSDGHFDIHCGIASGSVISGKIGTKTGKLDFTVIGDTVNMAARIKSQAELVASSKICVDTHTAQLVKTNAVLKEISNIQIKGKSGLHSLFEILEVN
ncbi:MAG: adenylate/guanylate cyclase domain-containing protein [Candidatus Rifleibacteriota bacterium]